VLPSRILKKNITESTMLDAREALNSGFGHGTLCTAYRQTQGRGRVTGRRWIDDGRGALLFTIILEKNSIITSFPLTQLLALALCRRLEKGYGLTPRIKWPNDVLLDGRKVAGILVEMEGEYFLGGMGLNVFQDEFPLKIHRPAVSLMQALKLKGAGSMVPLSPDKELFPLLSELEILIEEVPEIAEIESRLFGINAQVTVKLGDPSRNEILKGTLMGLQDDGSLLINPRDGDPIAVYSGEIGQLQPPAVDHFRLNKKKS